MSRYRPPGIKVVILDNPGTALLPSGLRVPCIVATGLTTKPITNIEVTKGSGDTDTITGYLTGEVSSVTKVGDYPDLQGYTENTDWRQVDHQILWISGQQAPTTGAKYYVSFRKPKLAAEYDDGVLYTDMQAVRDDFGDEIIDGILTPISAAAKLCFDNGAPAIVIIQAETASDSHLKSAIDAAQQEDVDLMVAPQCCNTSLNNYVKNHVQNMSSSEVGRERVWFRSADGMSDATTTIRASAVGMKDQLVTMMAPPAFVSTFRDSVAQEDQDILLPSGYLAAAYAGVVANPNSDAATPLTRKSLVGVKSLSTFDYKETEKNLLAGDGVTVVENNKGVIRVRHALTTDPSNVNKLTQSVVFIKHKIKKECRTLLDSAFIGIKAESNVKSRIAGTVEAFLRQQVRDAIVTDWRNIKVVQSTVDPRTFSVSFDIAPVYPTEFIDVTISLVTS